MARPPDCIFLNVVDAPTIFPARSSVVIAYFQPLLARLADSSHLVARDYPGYGHRDWPDRKQFDYSFDHFASVLIDFTQALGPSHYTLYMQDFGGSVGFRMALAHPERVQILIVQDAVAPQRRPQGELGNTASILGRPARSRRSAE